MNQKGEVKIRRHSPTRRAAAPLSDDRRKMERQKKEQLILDYQTWKSKQSLLTTQLN